MKILLTVHHSQLHEHYLILNLTIIYKKIWKMKVLLTVHPLEQSLVVIVPPPTLQWWFVHLSAGAFPSAVEVPRHPAVADRTPALDIFALLQSLARH
jgi:hypothetical protein